MARRITRHMEAKLTAFVQQMARMTTPTDGVRTEEERDDILVNLSSDSYEDEAMSFWHLVQEARELTDPNERRNAARRRQRQQAADERWGSKASAASLVAAPSSPTP